MVTSALVCEEDCNRAPIMQDFSQEEQPRRNSCPQDDANDNEENAPEEVERNVGEEERDSDVISVDSNGTGSGKSHILEAARCREKMPSSDSDKENISGISNCVVECDPSIVRGGDDGESRDYENSDQIPFPELLKIHPKQLVSGFEFGEATKRRAQENMKTARDKSLEENRKSCEITTEVSDETELEKPDDLDKPGCSKTISENDHKTPHSYKRQKLIEGRKNMTSADIDFTKTIRGIPQCLQDNPDCVEVWVYMIYKEEASVKLRNSRLFNDFKSVTPRMRAILLDWLMEVASVYHLRRVTYYLAADYFDRFLSIRPDIPKSLLQLVGITCLYIAAKVEEIYPPNLSEFAYVCDGACKSKEMVSCELLILNSLGWEVILTTPSDWLNLYMQLHLKSKDIVRSKLNLDFNKDFLFPEYSAYQFTRASQLMDLLSLDPGFLKFTYSTIAATAMYYMYGEKIALAVSGLTWEQMKPCAGYMQVFNQIIKDAPDPRLQSCLGGPHPTEVKGHNKVIGRSTRGTKNENYSFQTHIASMEYFERATIHRLSTLTRSRNFLKNKQKIDNPIVDDNDYNCATTPVSSKIICAGTDDEDEENEAPEDATSSLIDDLGLEGSDCNLLESLTTINDSANLKIETSDNLMSLDEIFELILSQDENKQNSDK